MLAAGSRLVVQFTLPTRYQSERSEQQVPLITHLVSVGAITTSCSLPTSAGRLMPSREAWVQGQYSLLS